jgi:hypothetical protein
MDNTNMSSQGGPADSLTHKPLFAGGLQFSDGTLAEDVINDLPAKVPLLVALSATSLARARGHGDDPLAAVLIAQEILLGAVHTAEEFVQVDDRGLPVHMEDVDEDASPSGVECTDAFHVSEASDTSKDTSNTQSEPPPGIRGAGGSIAALAERRRSSPKMPVSNTAEL